jgi:hypothetical protein
VKVLAAARMGPACSSSRAPCCAAPAGAYNAALEFASSAQDKAKAARAVALCYMGLKEFDRWAAGAWTMVIEQLCPLN